MAYPSLCGRRLYDCNMNSDLDPRTCVYDGKDEDSMIINFMITITMRQ